MLSKFASQFSFTDFESLSKSKPAQSQTGAGAQQAQAQTVSASAAPSAPKFDPLSYRSGDISTLPPDAFILHLNVTPNNTLYNVSDAQGNTKIQWSCGRAGFKGSAKSSAVANQQAAEQLAKKMLAKNIREVTVYLKGIGQGRRASVRGLLKGGIAINSFVEKTPIPHNGSRKPKKRRL